MQGPLEDWAMANEYALETMTDESLRETMGEDEEYVQARMFLQAFHRSESLPAIPETNEGLCWMGFLPKTDAVQSLVDLAGEAEAMSAAGPVNTSGPSPSSIMMMSSTTNAADLSTPSTNSLEGDEWGFIPIDIGSGPIMMTSSSPTTMPSCSRRRKNSRYLCYHSSSSFSSAPETSLKRYPPTLYRPHLR